jgi:hypothetical protein
MMKSFRFGPDAHAGGGLPPAATQRKCSSKHEATISARCFLEDQAGAKPGLSDENRPQFDVHRRRAFQVD